MTTLSIKNLNELNEDFCTSFQLIGDQFVAVELSSGAIYVSLWNCEDGVFSDSNTLLGKRSTHTYGKTININLIQSLVNDIQADLIKIINVKAFVNAHLSPSCYAYMHVMDSLLSDLNQAYASETIEDLQQEFTYLCNGSSGGTYWEDEM